MKKKIDKNYEKIIIFLLVIIPVVIYFQAIGFQFVWDDKPIYLNNSNFPDNFSIGDYLKFWNPANPGMYMPVTYTFWTLGIILNKIFSNNLFNPAIFHSLNIIFHILNGIFAFIILKKVLKHEWAAIAGSFLFLAHPIQIESVAWVSEFRGLLATFFGFAAIIYYLKYLDSKDKVIKYYLVSLLLFILALLSKPSAVVFPIIIVVLDYFVHRRKVIEIAKATALFFILAIPIILKTKLAEEETVVSFIAPLWAKPLIFLDAITFYLYKIINPFNLAVAYGRTPQYVMNNSDMLLLSCGIPIIIILALWMLRKRNNEYSHAFIIFIAGFLSVSGLISFYYQEWSTVADRYTYISMLGVAIGFSYLIKSIKNNKISSLISTIFLTLFSIITLVHLPVWENDFTLWDSSIKNYPDVSAQAYDSRGFIYLERKDYQNALSDFNLSVKINPNYPRAYYNRGVANLDVGKTKEALLDFSKAIELNFKNSSVWFNRGLCYSELNMNDKAISDYSESLKIMPNQADVYVNRGIAYAKSGIMDSAIADFQKALSINPNDEDAKHNLKMAFEEKQNR